MPLSFLRNEVKTALKRRIPVAIAVISGLILVNAKELRGTTLIVKFDDNRILLAADNRQGTLPPGQGTQSDVTTFNDQMCKIAVFGNSAFAETGPVKSEKVGLFATDPEFDSYRDASTALALSKDITTAATSWAQQTQDHFSAFYLVNSERVRAFVGTNKQGILVEGLFIGWEKQTPIALVAVVYLNPSSISGVSATVGPMQQVMNAVKSDTQGQTFTPNGDTEELMNNTTERAQKANAEWKELAKKMPKSDAAWKQLEFYVKKTSELDSSVSPTASVLSLEAEKSPSWIVPGACGK